MDQIYPYLAGLTDGDGNIYVTWKAGDHQFRIHIRFIMSTNDELKQILIAEGFNLYNYKGKSQYYFIVSGGKAIEIIKKLLPFLILKKERAELALKIWHLMPKIGHPYNKQIVNRIVDLLEEMRKYATRKSEIKWTREKILECFD
jgi:hypothetical protein